MPVSRAQGKSQQTRRRRQGRWRTQLPQRQVRGAAAHVPHPGHHKELLNHPPPPPAFAINQEVRVPVTKAAELSVEYLTTYS